MILNCFLQSNDGRIRLYQCDFLALTSDIVATKFDAVWDVQVAELEKAAVSSIFFNITLRRLSPSTPETGNSMWELWGPSWQISSGGDFTKSFVPPRSSVLTIKRSGTFLLRLSTSHLPIWAGLTQSRTTQSKSFLEASATSSLQHRFDTLASTQLKKISGLKKYFNM